jgi:hypothetical protein
MQLIGSRGQQTRDHYFSADGSIVAGNTSQLLLPERKSTSFLFIENLSNEALYLEFGGARATASISGGGVASCAIGNGGFGYVQPPKVFFYGGGNGGNSLFNGVGLPNWPAPGDAAFARPREGTPANRPAVAYAVLTTGVVSSIVIEDPGVGYVAAPYVFLENSLEPPDPFGVADPYFGSVNSGFLLPAPGASYYVNGTHCTTDAISIWGGTTGQAFTCRWSP